METPIIRVNFLPAEVSLDQHRVGQSQVDLLGVNLARAAA